MIASLAPWRSPWTTLIATPWARNACWMRAESRTLQSPEEFNRCLHLAHEARARLAAENVSLELRSNLCGRRTLAHVCDQRARVAARQHGCRKCGHVPPVLLAAPAAASSFSSLSSSHERRAFTSLSSSSPSVVSIASAIRNAVRQKRLHRDGAASIVASLILCPSLPQDPSRGDTTRVTVETKVRSHLNTEHHAESVLHHSRHLVVSSSRLQEGPMERPSRPGPKRHAPRAISPSPPTSGRGSGMRTDLDGDRLRRPVRDAGGL